MIISTVPDIAALDRSVTFCPLEFQYGAHSLGWLLILLWLFLFLFRLQRRRLGALLFLRRTLFFFRRRSALGLRTFAWERSL
jgi:hypothetical protein